jgi:hypothetical protein
MVREAVEHAQVTLLLSSAVFEGTRRETYEEFARASRALVRTMAFHVPSGRRTLNFFLLEEGASLLSTSRPGAR